ncbi:hypothetical protein A5802_001938, partial [Enterococcus mundtii]
SRRNTGRTGNNENSESSITKTWGRN